MRVYMEPSDLVLLPDGRTAIARRFRAEDEWTADRELDADFAVELEIEIDDLGRPRCVQLQVTPAEGEAVTGDILRAISIPQLTRKATVQAGGLLRFDAELPGGGARFVGPSKDQITEAFGPYGGRAQKPRRNSPITKKHLREVATIYRKALKSRSKEHAPTEAVGFAMGVSRSTAARWISLARREGLLGPAVPGRAGEARRART